VKPCLIKDRINKSIFLKNKILDDDELIQNINDAAFLINESIKAGGKVIFAGNGGSFADAQHLCAEFISRLILDRGPLPAVTLGVNGSNFSAIGNDYGFEHVFSRELLGLYRDGDIFVGITTSGKSKNILKALSVAESIGCKSILFNGENKVSLPQKSISIDIPSKETMHIQEAHIMVGHIICEIVENFFFGDN
jgi:D-sedoheptulose 7-phosphate isomerase